jgi:hypothetical protein
MSDSLLDDQPEKEEVAVNMEEPPQWTRQLPDKYKDDSRFHRHGTFSSFIDHHIGLEEKKGERQVPKTTEEYKASTEDLPEGMVKDTGLEDFMKNVAFEVGLDNEGFRKMYKKAYEYNDSVIKQLRSSKSATKEKAISQLKEEWGEGYSRNTEMARRALSSNDDSGEFRELLKETNLDNDPRAIRFLRHIGEKTSDDIAPTASGSNAPTEQKRYPNSSTMWARQREKASKGLTG